MQLPGIDAGFDTKTKYCTESVFSVETQIPGGWQARAKHSPSPLQRLKSASLTTPDRPCLQFRSLRFQDDTSTQAPHEGTHRPDTKWTEQGAHGLSVCPLSPNALKRAAACVGLVQASLLRWGPSRNSPAWQVKLCDHVFLGLQGLSDLPADTCCFAASHVSVFDPSASLKRWSRTCLNFLSVWTSDHQHQCQNPSKLPADPAAPGVPALLALTL